MREKRPRRAVFGEFIGKWLFSFSKAWYTIENPEGFLNKNAVARRQLPVLAHQRIFAVSAYLHGILDTAPKDRISDCTGCVSAFALEQTPDLCGFIDTAPKGRMSDLDDMNRT